ncbi:MAG: hypothetical protein H6739_02055 [Alphaproteobacteria bacterium]|nr:hypothetical protein [Alphaproteobacteria bacterium]
MQPDDNGKRWWLDDPKHVEWIFRGLCVVCALLVAADIFHLYHKHSHEGMDFLEMPGFYAFFGFVAYVGLVLTAKELRKVLMRDEDYYDG